MTAVLLDTSVQADTTAPRRGLVQQDTDTFFAFFKDSTNDILYRRSLDQMATFEAAVSCGAGGSSEQEWDLYYKRWNDRSNSDIVDVFWHQDAGTRGLYHRQVNLATNTVGSAHLVVGLGAAPGDAPLAGCVARSGRLWIAGLGPVADEVIYYSDDEGANWTEFTGGDFTEGDNSDQMQIWPDYSSANTHDIVAIFWDASANEISIKRLSATGDSITETSVSTSMTETGNLGNFASSFASDGHIRLAAFDTPNATGATLKTWDIYGATVTAKTDVITGFNQVHAVGMTIIDALDWTVVWYGRDSAQAHSSFLELYRKISTDGMVTWQAETLANTRDSDLLSINADPRPPGNALAPMWFEGAGEDLYVEQPPVEISEDIDQHRLMLSDGTDPDIVVLNITDKAIGDVGESIIKTERGRESAMLGRPPRAGRASFLINNYGLTYNLDEPTPGLATRLNKKYDGTWYHMWHGNIDVPEQEMQQGVFRPVIKIQANGPLAKLANKKVSTTLFEEITTGVAIGHVLDAADFPSFLRDIDAGDVTLPWFWANDEDAMTLILKLLNAEGITAELYEAGDGKLVFRDRSARYDESRSSDIQTTFTSQGAEPRLTGFTYVSGWREVVNEARATRTARVAGAAPSVVWTDSNGGGNYIIGPNDRVILEAVGAQPFASAITPVLNTDYASGFGTGTVTLERTSGQRTRITFTAGAGGWLIGPASGNDGIQLRATETVVGGTFDEINNETLTTTSIAKYGVRPWTGQMWSDMYWYDMRDNLDAIVTWLMDPRGRIRFGLNAARSGIELSAANEATAKREIGDRVRVTVPDLDFDGECWIERIEHEVFAPAGEADGTSVGREFTWYECMVIEVAVGSLGTGVTDTNPYDALNYEDYVGPDSFSDQGVTTTKNIMAGAL